MSKFVLVFFFLMNTFLYAESSLLKDIQILNVSSSSKVSFEEIKNSSNFKSINNYYSNNSEGIYFLKLTFNKPLDKNNYVIGLSGRLDFLDVSRNVLLQNLDREMFFILNQDNFNREIIFKLKSIDSQITLHINEDEEGVFYKEISVNNMLYGFAFGILFTAFLYYFALYLFNKEINFLYYSLLQLSLFLFFVCLENGVIYGFLFDFLLFCFSIFSVLFTKTFLNTKKKSPKIDKILSYIFLIFCIDFVLDNIFNVPIYDIDLPYPLFLLVYILAGINVYKKGDYPILFYLLGWSILIFSLIFVDISYRYDIEYEFLRSPVFILYFTSPLESLILAFALSYKMKMLEEEKNMQKEFVINQSKLASMGEMIGNIAHQWRQPLTHLSYILMNLKKAKEHDKLSNEYFDKKSNEAMIQLNFMSNTIEDFSNFFKLNKEKEAFSINQVIDESISLVKSVIEKNNIEINIKSLEDTVIYSYKGELLQVLFNLLNNANQELIKKGIMAPQININVHNDEKSVYLEISDNAAGISPEIINKIFEPYFSTKEKGLGIGLYMSKMIIENNMKGSLCVQNKQEGAKFTITLPLNS